MEDGFHTYARILEVRCAFYDARSREELSAEEIIGKPVLFFASVYDRVITRGYWPKIGKKLPLEPHLLDLPPVYTQDVLNPTKFEIFYQKTSRPASREECLGLEYFSVWDYGDMEERLDDWYAGRKNNFVEFMHKADIQGYYGQKAAQK